MDIITNQGQIDYEYKIDPAGQALNKNIQSNIIQTDLVLPDLQMIKLVDKSHATIDDILNYTVNLTNAGNILLSDINFKDILPSGVEFVVGSVQVDDVAQPTFDIVTGFYLGSMIIATTKKVTFQAKVVSLPSPNTVINKATTTYNYLLVSLLSGSSESNTVTTTINVDNISIVKSSDVSRVTIGDQITYTIIITNNGNIDATNIMFQDMLDNKLTFVPESVIINGTNETTYNPITGFNIPDIAPANTTTIAFKATVNDQ